MGAGRKKALLAIASAAAVFAGYFVYSTLDEDLHFKRRSLDYLIFIDSDLVRAVPVAEGAATYSYSGGDGNKPPYNGVEITSVQFPADAYGFVRASLSSMACDHELPPLADLDMTTTQPLRAECASASNTVSIYIGKSSQGQYYLSITDYNHDKMRGM